MDLSMLELNDSQERDAEQWRNLFEAADKNFQLRGI